MDETESLDASAFGTLPPSASPLYARIYEAIATHIKQKKVLPGVRIPTENQLAKHFDVSIITIRAALKQLSDEGFVHKRQGTGTFVGHFQSSTAPNWSIGTLDDLTRSIQASQLQILHMGIAKLPSWAAEQLNAQPGEKRFHACIVRLQNGIGVQLTEAFYPKDIGDQLQAQQLSAALEKNHLLVGAVAELTDQRVATIRQYIRATAATKHVAQALSIGVRTPVLQIARTSLTEDGKILQVARSHYQTNDIAYSFDLHRRDTAPGN